MSLRWCFLLLPIDLLHIFIMKGSLSMDYNSFKKYFSPKNNLWQIIGGVIIALAVPLFFMRMSMFGVVIVAIGACVFIFARDSRPSDADVDGAIEKKIKDIDNLAKQGIDLREKQIKAFPPVSFSEFDYSGDDIIVQKGADGKYRSNRYSAAEIIFTQEKLHIFMMQFSLVEEKEEQKYFDAKYTELKDAKIERRHQTFVIDKGTKKEKEVALEFESIVIRDNGDNIVFDMPVHDGADVDKTVDTVNRLIEAKKEGTVEFK